MIDETVHNYRLSAEQERAFCIVANHATCEFEMLKMYLGGMGGTGKSQVIKALVNLFTQQKEEHIFLILAVLLLCLMDQPTTLYLISMIELILGLQKIKCIFKVT